MKNKGKIKLMLSRNWIFGVVVILVFFLSAGRNSVIQTNMVSNPDTTISFASDLGENITQTWQAHSKEIREIGIHYEAKNEFSAVVGLRFISDSIVIAEKHLDCHFIENTDGILSFQLGRIKVEPGKQYCIELYYVSAENTGEINLDAGMEYGGCKVGEEETGKGLGYVISFAKPSRLWWLLISFGPLFAFSFLLMTWQSRKFEEVIAISVGLLGSILYFAGWMENLKLGINLIYVFAIAAFFAGIYHFNRRKIKFKDLLSPGIFVFAILIIIIIINAQDLFFARWDEYSHWGLAVKDMFFFDSFGKHVDTTVDLPRYFPFATLIEYWFVYHNGLFNEGMIYVGFQIMLLSALAPIMKVMRMGREYIMPSLLLLIAIPVCFFGDITNCIYVDPLLAAWLTYILLCYFSEKKSLFNWVRITAGIFALVMTKDIGIVLAGCALLIIGGDVFYRQYKEKNYSVKELKIPVFLGIMALLFFFSWQIYLSIPVKNYDEEQVHAEQTIDEASEHEVEKETVSDTLSASGITFKKVLELLRCEAPPYRYQTIKNFMIAIFDGENFQIGSIKFSYVDLLILMALGGWLLLGKINADYKGRGGILGIMILAAGVLYAAVLLITYLFSFSQGHALILHSFYRYAGSYLAGIFLLYLTLILFEVAKAGGRGKLILVFCAIMIIVTPMEHYILRNMDQEITSEERYGYEEIQELMRSIGEQGEKIYFVCNDSDGTSYLMFKNAACPLQVPYREWNIFASREAYYKQCDLDKEKGIETTAGLYLSVKELEEKLKQCKYLYLLHPNDVFAESYGELFEEPENIEDGTFYKVNVDETGALYLSYVGKIGIKSYK